MRACWELLGIVGNLNWPQHKEGERPQKQCYIYTDCQPVAKGSLWCQFPLWCMQMVQIFTYKHERCRPQARFYNVTTFAWNSLSSLFRVTVYTINELPGYSGPPRSAPAAWQMRAAAHGEGKYKGTPILSLPAASVHSSRRFSVLGEETCNVVWQSLHTAGLEVIAWLKNSALDFTCSPTHIHQSCFHSIVLYLLLLVISDTC